MLASLRFALPCLLVAACMSNPPGSVDGSIKGNSYPVAAALSATVQTTSGGGFGMVVLSSAADACSPAAAQVSHPGEKSVVVIVAANDGRAIATPPTATGTYAIPDPTADPVPNAMVATVFTSNLDATCENNADDQTTAVSGTVTIDSIDGQLYSGSFDVTLDSGDHVTGSFSPGSCSSLAAIVTGDNPPPTCKP
jgi:hypothetical protein|nr:hypothetical protein [Kofleriaceae bacterium]